MSFTSWERLKKFVCGDLAAVQNDSKDDSTVVEELKAGSASWRRQNLGASAISFWCRHGVELVLSSSTTVESPFKSFYTAFESTQFVPKLQSNVFISVINILFLFLFSSLDICIQCVFRRDTGATRTKDGVFAGFTNTANFKPVYNGINNDAKFGLPIISIGTVDCVDGFQVIIQPWKDTKSIDHMFMHKCTNYF